MGFTPTKLDGEWASMKDLAKMGETLQIAKGFLTSDDTNVYEGKVAPRWIIKSTVVSSGDEVQTGVTKGYSRDLNIQEAATYLDDNPDEVLTFRFVKGKGAYIGIEFDVDEEA